MVLGARLTLSRDMQRSQKWLLGELTTMGLANVAAEPFMDYGVAWDNEFVSLHMLEPDYSPMVAYPIAHTAGTNGRKVADAVNEQPWLPNGPIPLQVTWSRPTTDGRFGALA